MPSCRKEWLSVKPVSGGVVTSALGVRSRAAATIERNSSVSVGLSVAGQLGPSGVRVTAVSATTRTRSARNARGSWPGRRRTSRPALATGGSTSVLSLPVRPPRRRPAQGRLMVRDAVRAPHQPVDGIVGCGTGAMSGGTAGRDLEPEGRLLGGPDAVILDPPGGTRADRATLGEQELGVLYQLRVMLHHPRRPDAGAYLLVRRGEENDVTLERHAGAFEREQRHELRDRLAFHVERATSPQIAVLHGAGEGVDLPVPRAREHDIHVVEQDERPGAAVPGDARVQVRLPRRGLEQLRGDPLAREHGLEPLGRLALVARRVGGVDGDVL